MPHGWIYTQQKSSLTLRKIPLSRRWMSSSFWYQTWRNRLINNSSNHLNVEMKNCKCYHSSIFRIQICSAISCSIQLNGFILLYTCTVEWLYLQFFFKMYLSLSKWLELCYLSTNYFKFCIKMREHPPALP